MFWCFPLLSLHSVPTCPCGDKSSRRECCLRCLSLLLWSVPRVLRLLVYSSNRLLVVRSGDLSQSSSYPIALNHGLPTSAILGSLTCYTQAMLLLFLWPLWHKHPLNLPFCFCCIFGWCPPGHSKCLDFNRRQIDASWTSFAWLLHRPWLRIKWVCLFSSHLTYSAF